MKQVLIKVMAGAFSVALWSCVSPASNESSFHTGEADVSGMMFNWEFCPEHNGRGCINGNLSDKPYSLGFAEEGRLLAGTWGEESVHLTLDESSVSALGTHIFEVIFYSKEEGLVVSVTWNSEKNQVIGHDFVISK